MNTRDAKIIKAALDFLHEREASLSDMTIRDEVRNRVSPPCGRDEYLAAMKIADDCGWVVTAPASVGDGYRRGISEEGEIARLKLGRE